MKIKTAISVVTAIAGAAIIITDLPHFLIDFMQSMGVFWVFAWLAWKGLGLFLLIFGVKTWADNSPHSAVYEEQADESPYHAGDIIHIKRVWTVNGCDPEAKAMEGLTGTVSHTDAAGMLHGDWGKLALDPWLDDLVLIKTK